MAPAYLIMRLHRPQNLLASALLCALLAAVGCARTRVVGASGSDPSDLEPRASAGAKAKHGSAIAASGNELLGYNNPILGDIDGDGLADFIVSALSPELFEDELTVVHYVFYGRSEFPERLSTADADAAIVTSTSAVWPLGDINGDKLADFALNTRRGDIEIVFGDRVRKSGKSSLNGQGAVWRSPTLPPPFAAEFSTLNYAIGAGDVDCDGIDDVLVSAMRDLEPGESESSALFGLVHATYVVRGSPTIPTGEWDPSWAIARFSPEFESESLIAARDLDGDGCGDIFGAIADTLYVFYGGGQVFGVNSPLGRTIDSSRADAALQRDVGALYSPLGDLDADGVGDVIFRSLEAGRTFVVYGPNDRQRWTGRVQLTPDLLLDFHAPMYAPVSVDTGDIDGDMLPELVIGWGAVVTGDELEASIITPSAIYAIRNSGTRLRGSYSLDTRDKIEVGPAQPPSPSSSAVGGGLGSPFSLAGDVDGDGGNDIIAGTPELGVGGAVYIIPSTPRAPD